MSKLFIIGITLLSLSCMPSRYQEHQKEFEVKKIIELKNGKREVVLQEIRTRKIYYTICECDTVRVGLKVKVNLIIPK